MSCSIATSSGLVVAGMAPPRSKSAFNRGSLLIRGEGRIIHVRSYTSDGSAHGPSLSEEDLEALLYTEHATALSEPVKTKVGAALWVFRPNFVGLDAALAELGASGIPLATVQSGVEHSKLCVVDESTAAANSLRWSWCVQAREQAITAAKISDWLSAEAHAQRSFAIAPGFDAQSYGLLAVCYERRGRKVRAQGMHRVALRSRGAAFAEEFAQFRDSYAQQLPQRRMHQGFRDALRATGVADGLGQSASPRLLAP